MRVHIGGRICPRRPRRSAVALRKGSRQSAGGSGQAATAMNERSKADGRSYCNPWAAPLRAEPKRRDRPCPSFPRSSSFQGLNGSNGFQLNGEAAGNRAGWSVASAGDVNRDGFADLIIGAFNANVPTASAGASYVVFGKAVGLCRQPQSVDP